MPGIHRKRRKQPTTDEQYAKMLGRMLTAWKPRAVNDPITGLRHLRQFRELLEDAANTAIADALSDDRQPRLSPTELADAYGVSRQAIYKRLITGQAATGQRSHEQVTQLPPTRVAQPRELPPA
jgi:hypothetical protein